MVRTNERGDGGSYRMVDVPLPALAGGSPAPEGTPEGDELAALIAEQERDMRLGHRVSSISLDDLMDMVVRGEGVLASLAVTGHRHLRVARVFGVPKVAPVSKEQRARHQYVEPELGFCRAFIDLGFLFSGRVRCSFRATVGEFCLGHAKRNGVLAYLEGEAVRVL
jgi:hypothetical protein